MTSFVSLTRSIAVTIVFGDGYPARHPAIDDLKSFPMDDYFDYYHDGPTARDHSKGSPPPGSLLPEPRNPIGTYVVLLRRCLQSVHSLDASQPNGAWLCPLLQCHFVQRADEARDLVQGVHEGMLLNPATLPLKYLGARLSTLREEVRATKCIQAHADYKNDDPSTLDVEMLERLIAQVEDKDVEMRAAFETIMQQKNIENAELSIKESKSAITCEYKGK